MWVHFFDRLNILKARSDFGHIHYSMAELVVRIICSLSIVIFVSHKITITKINDKQLKLSVDAPVSLRFCKTRLKSAVVEEDKMK